MTITYHSDLRVALGFGGESVDPPYLAKHGSKGEREAGREDPGSGLAHSGVGTWSHEPAVQPQQEHPAQTHCDAEQHDGVTHRMRRLDHSVTVNNEELLSKITSYGKCKIQRNHYLVSN